MQTFEIQQSAVRLSKSILHFLTIEFFDKYRIFISNIQGGSEETHVFFFQMASTRLGWV